MCWLTSSEHTPSRQQSFHKVPQWKRRNHFNSWLDWGRYPEVKLILMFNTLQNDFHMNDVNCRPQSEAIPLGNPYSLKTWLNSASAASEAAGNFERESWHTLENLSVIMSTVVIHREGRMSVMKFRARCHQSVKTLKRGIYEASWHHRIFVMRPSCEKSFSGLVWWKWCVPPP